MCCCLAAASTQPVHKKTVDGTQSQLPSTTNLEQYQRFTRLSTTTSDPDNDLTVSWSSEGPDLVAKVNSGELDRFLAGLRVDGVRVVDEIADQPNPSRAPTTPLALGAKWRIIGRPDQTRLWGPGNDESPRIESEDRWTRSNHWLSPHSVRKESAIRQ